MVQVKFHLCMKDPRVITEVKEQYAVFIMQQFELICRFAFPSNVSVSVEPTPYQSLPRNLGLTLIILHQLQVRLVCEVYLNSWCHLVVGDKWCFAISDKDSDEPKSFFSCPQWKSCNLSRRELFSGRRNSIWLPVPMY
jgi:hypothetical protein